MVEGGEGAIAEIGVDFPKHIRSTPPKCHVL